MDGMRMDPHGAARRAAAALCVAVAAGLIALSSCSDALINEMTRLATEANLPTISPAANTTITAHEVITLTLPNAEVGAEILLLGTIWAGPAPGASTLGADKQVVVNAAGSVVWGAGNGKTLGVRVTSAGQTTTYTYTYTVFKGVCVNGAAGVGQDTNAGTVLAPVASVQKGIDLVQSLYTTGEVHVAQRSTNPTLNQYSASNIVAAMVEGISLYGGYSLDFSVRNPAAYETVLVDSSTNGGTTPFGTMSATNQPNRAVYFPPGITSATVIDGFTVMPGSGNSNAAVSVCGGSPTIQNLKITGAANPISGTGKYVIGIYVFDPNGAAHAASPVIKNCVIDPGWTTAESDTTGNAIGVGLDNCAAPQVKSSTISGGHGYITKAFSCRSDTAFLTTTTTIQGNSIDCGAAASVATGLHYCIFFGPTIGVSITSNSFHNAGAADTHYAIYESRTQGSVAHSPASVSSNTFSLSGFASGGTGGYYFDNNATAILDLTSNITLNTGTAVTDDTTTTLTAGGNIQN